MEPQLTTPLRVSKQNNLYKTLYKRFLQATVNHGITWELGSPIISRCPQAQKLQLRHQEKWSRLLNPGRWTIQLLATSCRSHCFSSITSQHLTLQFSRNIGFAIQPPPLFSCQRITSLVHSNFNPGIDRSAISTHLANSYDCSSCV